MFFFLSLLSLPKLHMLSHELRPPFGNSFGHLSVDFLMVINTMRLSPSTNDRKINFPRVALVRFNFNATYWIQLTLRSKFSIGLLHTFRPTTSYV